MLALFVIGCGDDSKTNTITLPGEEIPVDNIISICNNLSVDELAEYDHIIIHIKDGECKIKIKHN